MFLQSTDHPELLSVAELTPGLQARQLAEELARRWQAGERTSVEDLLAQHPELQDDAATVLHLIHKEFCLRQENNETINVSALVQRFPRWQTELQVMFLGNAVTEPPRPSHPDELRRQAECAGEFKILTELGRGTQGSVFLATQSSLAHRPVVVKVTRGRGQEYLSLARLQHSHIVPLHAVFPIPGRAGHVLCMPYLGGATLHHLLQALASKPVTQRTGHDLLAALDAYQAGIPLKLQPQGPVRAFVDGLSWTETLCWLGICLAEGLHYAHERNLVHLDVKPANILFSVDGQPMLLDFHIANTPLLPPQSPPENFGGTLAYCSPEQRQALRAVPSRAPVKQAVDRRSDIYSLGVVLAEALGGELPVVGRPGQRSDFNLPRLNANVSRGLADILARCLESDPGRRYPTAQAVADDLRRHLGSRPLLGVPNRCFRERWHKWRRRRPQALTVSLLTLAVVAAVLSFGLLAWADICRDRQEAEESLHEGRQLLAAKQYELALERFDDGLQHCQAMTANPKMVLLLRQEQSRCQRAREIERLHQLAERMRYLCASLNNPREISPALRQHWTEVWRSRHQVLDARLEGLDGTLREQLRLDLLDMAVIWADLLLREEKRSRENVLERVRLLAEVETLFGSNPVLRDLPLLSEKQTGSVPRAVLDQERSTAWEQFALGRRCLLRGELTEAAAFFQQAVNKQPNGFWPSYYQGICAYRLGAYQEAVTAFRACIALAPESALSYYNRGIAYAKLGGNYCPLALGDFSRALELDPKLAEAALNRGVMFLKNGQLARAHQDFQKALQLGADEAQVHFNLAQLYLLREDRKAALASLRLALKATSALAEARFLLQELQMSPGAGAGN